MSLAPKLTPSAQAWLEGVRAFRAQQPRDANPYATKPMENDLSVKLSAAWFQGWDDSDIIVNELSPQHLEVAHG